MSNRFSPKNMGQRQQARNMIERIEDLERAIPKLVQNDQGLSTAASQIQDVVNQHATLIQAVIRLFGVEAMEGALADIREEKDVARAASAKAALAEGVAAGYMIPTQVIEEKSMIVAAELNKDGGPVGQGRLQNVVANLIESIKVELMGKGVGAEVATPNGGKLIVEEIYTVDEDRYQQILAERQEALAKENETEEARTRREAEEAQDLPPDDEILAAEEHHPEEESPSENSELA